MRCAKRIQLSRPRRTACCKVPKQYNVHPNSELSVWYVGMQKLYSEPDGIRREEEGRIAEPSPITSGRVAFAGVRSSVVVLHAGPRFSGDNMVVRCLCLGGLIYCSGWRRRVRCVC